MSDQIPQQKEYVYRHKTIRRFRVENFEFKNHELRITSERDRDRFEDILSKLPISETNDIVEINEAAAAAAERPVGQQRVIRGAGNASDLLTPEDKARIAAAADQTTSGMPASGQANNLLSAFKNQQNQK